MRVAPSAYRVTKAYDSPYTVPWRVQLGDRLVVTPKESEGDGWLWCTRPDGESRWVPAGYLERRDEVYVMLRDYEATELAVNEGETVAASGPAESGWFWCTAADGRSGWVPAENLAG